MNTVVHRLLVSGGEFALGIGLVESAHIPLIAESPPLHAVALLGGAALSFRGLGRAGIIVAEQSEQYRIDRANRSLPPEPDDDSA